VQNNTGNFITNFLKFQTELGGGMELYALVLYGLIWKHRQVAFYYLVIMSVNRSMGGILKLSYANPRPYMLDSNIIPESCAKAFGNPSGHSAAASCIAVALFLDVFHGTTQNLDKKYKPYFYSKMTYFACLLFALYWAVSLPFSRYLIGVHSLDQIVEGSMIGLWQGLFLHFVLRDHIISHLD
jgi:membrane-associated phospholipid phosphatase